VSIATPPLSECPLDSLAPLLEEHGREPIGPIVVGDDRDARNENAGASGENGRRRRRRMALPAPPCRRDDGSSERAADMRCIVDAAAARVRKDPEKHDETEPPSHGLRERTAPAGHAPADDHRGSDYAGNGA